jgi:hypothetical protein
MSCRLSASLQMTSLSRSAIIVLEKEDGFVGAQECTWRCRDCSCGAIKSYARGKGTAAYLALVTWQTELCLRTEQPLGSATQVMQTRSWASRVAANSNTQHLRSAKSPVKPQDHSHYCQLYLNLPPPVALHQCPAHVARDYIRSTLALQARLLATPPLMNRQTIIAAPSRQQPYNRIKKPLQ